MKVERTFRDVLALPFLLLGLYIIKFSARIGGTLTALKITSILKK